MRVDVCGAEHARDGVAAELQPGPTASAGAGRDVALEQLTIVERGLLANLRAFQRYRHGFYTQVAVGELGVTGPQRRGGFFGGTGLTGFTGQGSGGLGGVGSATGFGRAGFGTTGGGGTGGGAGFAGGGAGEVGGFLGLLQQLQQIRNTRDSLALQLAQLEQLEAYQDAGLITLIQVDNFRQNIETERGEPAAGGEPVPGDPGFLQDEHHGLAARHAGDPGRLAHPPVPVPRSAPDRARPAAGPAPLGRRRPAPAPAAADMLAIVESARGSRRTWPRTFRTSMPTTRCWTSERRLANGA